MTEPAEGLGQRIILGDDGLPSAVLDMDQITDTGSWLAFSLASASDNPEAVDALIGNYLANAGPQEFAYIAASALSVMTRHLLADAIEALRSLTGRDIRAEATATLDDYRPPA